MLKRLQHTAQYCCCLYRGTNSSRLFAAPSLISHRGCSTSQLWRHSYNATACHLRTCGTRHTPAPHRRTLAGRAAAQMGDKHKLLPLKLLFGNPRNTAPKVSPDGQKLAYLAPSDKDVLNVWLKPAKGGEGSIVTNDTHRGIRQFQWAQDSKHILYMQDVGGDENWHLYKQSIEGGEAQDLTPFENVRAQNILTDKHHPSEVLVGLNKRDPSVFDMHRIDLASGDVNFDTENPGDVMEWITDDSFAIRGAEAMDPADGSTILRIRDSADAQWRDLLRWPQDENGGGVAFSKDGSSIFVLSSLGSDTSHLQRISSSDAAIQEDLASSDRADVATLLMDDDTREVQAVAFNYLRTEWRVIASEVAADFEKLQAQLGDISIISRSTDKQVWIVAAKADDSPTAFHSYNRQSKDITFLFHDRPELTEYPLAKMEPLTIQARDGLTIPAYLTLPVGQARESRPQLPLVLLVHGGPWARDSWGYSSMPQWLANRGYACLQVNFRGSTGFGKAFLHAGDKQWGTGTMQHDLTDAVRWAVDQGIADEAKVLIMGGSYGGYATLAGLTFTPELYCAGVDIVGPSHVKTLLETIPAYWQPMKQLFLTRMGDPENDQELNERISPLFHVDKIRVPLIIAQGANDPRVKQAESDQIYEAMKAKKIPVEYLVYTDEGHGFARPPNSLDFFSRVDQFLAKYLGGLSEPQLHMEGSSVQVVSAA